MSALTIFRRPLLARNKNALVFLPTSIPNVTIPFKIINVANLYSTYAVSISSLKLQFQKYGFATTKQQKKSPKKKTTKDSKKKGAAVSKKEETKKSKSAIKKPAKRVSSAQGKRATTKGKKAKKATKEKKQPAVKPKKKVVKKVSGQSKEEQAKAKQKAIRDKEKEKAQKAKEKEKKQREKERAAKEIEREKKLRLKAEKDAKPRRPLSPYIIFIREQYQKVATDNPEHKAPEMAKILAKKWKSLNPKQKEPYIQKANQDKERHKKEMEEYVKTLPPKRPLSAYMIFANSMRSKVEEDHPDYSITQVAKELGERWRQLPDKEKSKYKDQAAKLKTKYESDRAKWRQQLEE